MRITYNFYLMKSPLAYITASILDQNFLKGGWWPPCPCQPLPPRSWTWGRPGCYEGVYWPLSQFRTTWNNLKDYTFELGGQISLDQWSFRLAFSPSWVLLAVFWAARPQNPLSLWGQKAFIVLILSWEARFPWTNGTRVLHVGLHQSWVILAVFWVARPQNPLSAWGQKTFFV